MVTSADYIELNPERYSSETLIAAARGRTTIDGVTPELAVSLLRRKGERGGVEHLASLLRDSDLPERVRWTAAVELGRVGSMDAVEVLRRAQFEGPDLVRRGAAQALAQSAVEQHVAEPSAHAWRHPYVDVIAAFRDHREFTLPFPERLLREVSGTTADMRIGRLPARAAKRVAREIGVAVGADLDHRRALAVECGHTSLAYFPRADASTDPRELLERTTLLGYVAVHREDETDRWEQLFDVLTQPGRETGTAEVLVTNTAGDAVYAGVLRAAEDGSLSFEVNAVEGGGAGPTRVTGRYDGEVAIEEAVSTPAPIGLPVIERPTRS